MNENESNDQAPEPITLEIQDGVIGGTSNFTEGDE